MIADLAKSRGVPAPTPDTTLTGFEDIAEEITGMHKEVAALAKAERERARDGDSPGNAMSVHAPGGISMRRAPAWLVLAVVIVAAMAYVVGQIAAHPTPASLPVTTPAHS
jgi:hypothetical protein